MPCSSVAAASAGSRVTRARTASASPAFTAAMRSAAVMVSSPGGSAPDDAAHALGDVLGEGGQSVERLRHVARAVPEGDRALLEPHAVGEQRALGRGQL